MAKLHELLSATDLDNNLELQKQVHSHVRFYASWFPKETRQEFDKAFAKMVASGRLPSKNFLTLERLYMPNSDHFLETVCKMMAEWNRRHDGKMSLDEGGREELAFTSGLALSWQKELSPAQAQRVKEVFEKAYAIISVKDYHWNVGFMTRILITSYVEKLAGRTTPPIKPADLLTEKFFQGEPGEILEALKAVVELKKKDPTLSVVGMSLGLEVPNSFRPVVINSAIYKELREVCLRLKEMGVAVVVASGNDDTSGVVNMLGFMDVTLVGALNDKLTADGADDTASKYTTGGDSENRLQFWAHADPVLFYLSEKDLAWMEQGGTSSAQPHFSGALLDLRSANPSLTLDECYRILRLTSDPATTDPQVRKIDPMEAVVLAAHLPGSVYQGERLVRLTKALGFDPATFMAREAAKAFMAGFPRH